MFLGKPDRLQGILYDIENFYGIKDFVIHLFIAGSCAIGIEALWLLIKGRKRNFLDNAFVLLFFIPLFFYFLSEDIFYKADEVTPTQVSYSTLLVASSGGVYNFNLDKKRLSWKYESPLDSSGNRTSFVLNGQHIFMPFESGSLNSFDVNTGEIVWKQQIYGRDNSGISVSRNSDNAEEIGKLTPLFMSSPLVGSKNIVIASHGQPNATTPFLYSFDKHNGDPIWQKRLPTHFNYFAPLKYKGSHFDFYFVNSAVYLTKHGANSGSRYSYGMHESNRFKDPIYNQMQTDGKTLFIGDEKGRFYALPLDEDANVLKNDISDTSNTFIENPSIFKWIYSHEDFEYTGNQITFLDNGVLFAEVQSGTADQSAIIAINTASGDLEWQRRFSNKIQNWSLLGNRIVGYTLSTIFYIDTSSRDLVEFNIQNMPISNIEQIDSSRIIYLTRQGIEILDLSSKMAELVIENAFSEKQHNNSQIKYIEKRD